MGDTSRKKQGEGDGEKIAKKEEVHLAQIERIRGEGENEVRDKETLLGAAGGGDDRRKESDMVEPRTKTVSPKAAAYTATQGTFPKDTAEQEAQAMDGEAEKERKSCQWTDRDEDEDEMNEDSNIVTIVTATGKIGESG